jgi:hypothetical protein
MVVMKQPHGAQSNSSVCSAATDPSATGAASHEREEAARDQALFGRDRRHPISVAAAIERRHRDNGGRWRSGNHAKCSRCTDPHEYSGFGSVDR